jgi:hypothetical protein
MRLKYGSYWHESDEAFIDHDRASEQDQSGIVISEIETWTIGGRLEAATQSALTAAIAALEAAYTLTGQDIILYENDGTTPSALAMYSANTVGGVIVTKRPSYGAIRNGAYSTWIDYTIQVQAKQQINNGSSNPIVEWTETLSFTGTGGPRHIAMEVRNGQPVVQRVSQATPCRAFQSGRAVGYSSWYLAPPPIWPQWLKHPEVGGSVSTPKIIGSGSTREKVNFETTWNYVFESPGPLKGFPTAQPG